MLCRKVQYNDVVYRDPNVVIPSECEESADQGLRPFPFDKLRGFGMTVSSLVTVFYRAGLSPIQ
jgi:hypothetical protein